MTEPIYLEGTSKIVDETDELHIAEDGTESLECDTSGAVYLVRESGSRFLLDATVSTATLPSVAPKVAFRELQVELGSSTLQAKLGLEFHPEIFVSISKAVHEDRSLPADIVDLILDVYDQTQVTA